jgi:hypothetical protein
MHENMILKGSELPFIEENITSDYQSILNTQKISQRPYVSHLEEHAGAVGYAHPHLHGKVVDFLAVEVLEAIVLVVVRKLV